MLQYCDSVDECVALDEELVLPSRVREFNGVSRVLNGNLAALRSELAHDIAVPTPEPVIQTHSRVSTMDTSTA